MQEFFDNNPCGSLKIRHPFINVSGFLTERARQNAILYLFLSPDTSFNTSLFVVENCPAISRWTLLARTEFDLGLLPEGNYIVVLDAGSSESGQGFPIIHETNDSNLTIRMAFHGGSQRYSMTAFSILARDDERLESEHAIEPGAQDE